VHQHSPSRKADDPRRVSSRRGVPDEVQNGHRTMAHPRKRGLEREKLLGLQQAIEAVHESMSVGQHVSIALACRPDQSRDLFGQPFGDQSTTGQ